MKNRIMTQFWKILFVIAFFIFIEQNGWGQVSGDFRSIATGNWNVTTIWESYDGSTWSATSTIPTASNNVYLQIGFIVTLTQNEACNDLHINAGTSTIIAISTFTLEVNGKLRAYTGALGTIPGTSTATVGSACITSTNGVGKMKFVGTTRTIMLNDEWGNNPQAWDAEFAPTAGNTFSIQTGFEARNIIVSSGTVTSSSSDFRPDGDAAGTGTLTVKSGAVLQFSGASVNIKRLTNAGATSHFGTLTVESGAVLDFSGNSSPVIGASTFTLNGTVKYSGAGAQTLAVKGGNSAGVDISIYSNLYLTGSGGVKTLGIATTVTGTLTLAGTASLALGAFTLTYGAASTLEYAGSGIQTSTLSEFPVTSVNNLIINNTNEVIIDATRTIIGNATVYPLTNLTLNASCTLTVGGGFLIQSDATGTGSFIKYGTLTVGTSTVQKYLTDSRWWYVGSPMISGASTAAFGSLSAIASTGKRLLFYNEILQVYTAIGNGDDLNIAQRGYSFRNFTPSEVTTVAFTGTLNTAAIGAPGNLTRQASGTFNGYNLVCNPYPSAINWGSDNTPTPGLTKTTLENTIWYRTNGGFATYNSSANGTGVNGGQQYIPAMQAFWVRVAEGNTTGGIQVTNTIRVHNNTQSFYKTAVETNVFRMNVSNGINTDETVVGFYTNALSTFENYDSEKMFYTDEDVPQIYSLTSENIQTAINGQPELILNDERIIPLGFSTPVSGTFTFTATNLNDFNAAVSVYLEDVQQNVLKDLRQNISYTFTSGVVNNANRFRLHFGNIAANISNTAANNSILIYAVNNTVYVNTQEKGNGIIEIYDILGKKIMSQQSVEGLNKLQPNVSGGIYMVKVQTSGNMLTKKVVIN
jgi:hypothetical protein